MLVALLPNQSHLSYITLDTSKKNHIWKMSVHLHSDVYNQLYVFHLSWFRAQEGSFSLVWNRIKFIVMLLYELQKQTRPPTWASNFSTQLFECRILLPNEWSRKTWLLLNWLYSQSCFCWSVWFALKVPCPEKYFFFFAFNVVRGAWGAEGFDIY